MSNAADAPFQIKCRTTGKAIPPQPIKMKIPGWGGSADLKMENGSDPQPWHCPPFVDGAAYGVELLYPYDNECHVVNVGGEIQFLWDHAKEPGAKLTGQEFGTFAPKPIKFYLFQTGLDMQAPPGHAIRVEPHPRFYTDATGTVPPAIVGHVQTEWWGKTIFAVFKVPAVGQRHIFRKGEPYAQVLLVPHAKPYEVVPMEAEIATKRAKLDRDLSYASPYIAKSVWFNKEGDEFRDHYRIMERAYVRGGQAGLDNVVLAGIERFKESIPAAGTTIEVCLATGQELHRQGRYIEARTVYQHVLSREPNNDKAIGMWGLLAADQKAHDMAIDMLKRATQLAPEAPEHHANLGRLLLRLNRMPEAVPELRRAVELAPTDAVAMSDLGVALSQTGNAEEGLQLAQTAAAKLPDHPVTHFHAGFILANLGRHDEARESLERALAIDPNFVEPKRILEKLPGGGGAAAKPSATPSWE